MRSPQGLTALIKRRKAAKAKKHHAHGHASHHGSAGHGKAKKAKKTAGARKVPHPKPRTVAA